MSRLAAKGEIASPARGFYVIVLPEYRRLGCLPADQFVPALMGHRGIRYHVGLLSAAQYHSAAHHRPQEFEVVLEHVGAGDKVALLKEYVGGRARNFTKPLPGVGAHDLLSDSPIVRKRTRG